MSSAGVEVISGHTHVEKQGKLDLYRSEAICWRNRATTAWTTEKKHSKTSNIVKYKLFSVWMYAKMSFIAVIKAEFSASLLFKSSQVTFIYIALSTIQIVTKQLHTIKMGK